MATSERTPPLRAPPRAALAAVAHALTELGPKAMIIGGIAVIARGVARATRDVDATIAFDGDADDLVARLKNHELVSVELACADRSRRELEAQ